MISTERKGDFYDERAVQLAAELLRDLLQFSRFAVRGTTAYN